MRVHGGEPVRAVDLRRGRARQPQHRDAAAQARLARRRPRADTRQEPGHGAKPGRQDQHDAQDAAPEAAAQPHPRRVS